MTDESDLLRSLVDHLSAMVAYWDSSLFCRFANRAYERWLGVTPESMLGKQMSLVLGPLWEESIPHVEAVLRGEPQEFERIIPDPLGGPPRHGLASYIPDIVDGSVRGFFVLATDVSALKRTESALRESEERFRLTLDEAPIGMALVAPDGRFIRVNRALSEIVGYTPDELVGLTFQAITHPDDLDADLALVEQLARGEISRYHLEKRYIRENGTTVDVMLNASVLRGRDGQPLYFISQIEDITERKRAQKRFELALEGADLGSWDWNMKSGEIIVNARWAEMRGYRLDEIAPRVASWTAGVHPDDRTRVQCKLDEHFAGRSAAYECEHRVRTRSGSWIWVLDRGKVFERDEAGRPARMVGTERDITESKRLQDKQTFLAEVGTVLARSTLSVDQTLKAIARLSVRHLADCVIVDVVEGEADGDGVALRRAAVVHADPARQSIAEELERYPLERDRPHLAWSVLLDKNPMLVNEVTDGFLTANAQSNEHLRLLRELDPRSLMAVPLTARERLIGALVFVSSSPERRFGPHDLALAEELADRAALAIDNAQLYETARRATQRRDEVLGVVAHDLRNPLSTILVQASLLGSSALRGGELIKRAAARMNRLIQDLLDVTRMEAGRFSVKQARVPAGALVSDSVEAQLALATSASLTLRCDAEPDLPEVWADRDRLHQVFENLIGNAMKFTGPGGAITVAATARDGEVEFSVADTGAGIAPEDVPHLFEHTWQFYSDKSERRSSGLGLAIVKGLIDAHGGRIWVDSPPGQGCTVSFTIPTADPLRTAA